MGAGGRGGERSRYGRGVQVVIQLRQGVSRGRKVYTIL